MINREPAGRLLLQRLPIALTSYRTKPNPSPNRLKIAYEKPVSNVQRYLDHQEIKMADGLSSARQDESFEEWLICRMRQLGLDEDVFGSYVTGVLDSEDTDEDRKDALIGILEGMTVGSKLN